MSKIKLFLAVPTIGTIYDAQVYALERIKERYADTVEIVRPELLVNRIFHDYARNSMVDEFLASDCDVMWFLDSDVCPPVDALDVLVEHGDKWKLAGLPYPVFVTPTKDEGPKVVFTVYKQMENGKLSPSRIPYSGTDFVDGIATGCLFIKREVFNDIKAPYFEFKYDPTTRALVEGEDLGFCLKARDRGYKFFVDYSKVCKHRKNVDLLEVNNYAIEYANKAVKEYDAAIRGQVEMLVKQIAELKAQQSKIPGRTKGGLIIP